jgi:hypothetical protein
MKGKEPRFEQVHGGISLSAVRFPQKVIEAQTGVMVRGRESQKSSTFVNYSGRLSGGHFPLMLKGKAVKGHAPWGRSQKRAHCLLSLYLRRNRRIGIISENQISSTFVTLTRGQAGPRPSPAAGSP